jgi:type I restriction enzyme, R subunit
MPDPEKLARQEIDALLGQCGWVVQDKNAVNLAASRGVAVRELTFKTGEPDCTLFIDGKAIGTVQAKPAGHSLTGVEGQSMKSFVRASFTCKHLARCHSRAAERLDD